MAPYIEKYPSGSDIQIRDHDFLETFRQNWKYHHPIELEQIGFASHQAKIKSVAFYHGGDVLYTLHGIPGIWHEQCIEPLHHNDP